jgi:hypothetical protein
MVTQRLKLWEIAIWLSTGENKTSSSVLLAIGVSNEFEQLKDDRLQICEDLCDKLIERILIVG